MAANIAFMVRRYILSHNYEGLCNCDAECGCDLDDLFACCEPNEKSCRAAYRFDCARCMDGPNHNDDCRLCLGYSDYVMSTDADYCHPVYVSEASDG